MTSTESSPRSAPGRRSLLAPIAVAVVAGALGLIALTSGADPAPEEAATTSELADGGDPSAGPDASDPPDEVREQLAALERREPGDPLALGDADAPLVMIEWADFQCPFCGAFARDTKPELVDRYVDQGLLRIEWRDLPVLGDESHTAALAGRAAANQDAFWELHDEIFAEDRDRNAGELARGRLIEMADDLGLDADRFAADLDDPDAAAAVAEDAQIARTLGITGTPAFLIDGQPLMGGQPTEVFVAAIEQLLEQDDQR